MSNTFNSLYTIFTGQQATQTTTGETPPSSPPLPRSLEQAPSPHNSYEPTKTTVETNEKPLSSFTPEQASDADNTIFSSKNIPVGSFSPKVEKLLTQIESLDINPEISPAKLSSTINSLIETATKPTNEKEEENLSPANIIHIQIALAKCFQKISQTYNLTIVNTDLFDSLKDSDTSIFKPYSLFVLTSDKLLFSTQTKLKHTCFNKQTEHTTVTNAPYNETWTSVTQTLFTSFMLSSHPGNDPDSWLRYTIISQFPKSSFYPIFNSLLNDASIPFTTKYSYSDAIKNNNLQAFKNAYKSFVELLYNHSDTRSEFNDLLSNFQMRIVLSTKEIEKLTKKIVELQNPNALTELPKVKKTTRRRSNETDEQHKARTNEYTQSLIQKHQIAILEKQAELKTYQTLLSWVQEVSPEPKPKPSSQD